MKRIVRAAITVLGLTLLASTACDRGVVEPPGHGEFERVQILNHATGELLATWTHDDGWDTDVLATLSHADETEHTRLVLRARIWEEDGSEIELTEGGEFSVRYGVPTGGDPDGVINLAAADLFHGDHVYVYAHEGVTGTAQLEFHLWHGGHPDETTDPIAVTVTD